MTMKLEGGQCASHACLQEVAAVSPEERLVLCQQRGAGGAREVGDVPPALLVHWRVLALHPEASCQTPRWSDSPAVRRHVGVHLSATCAGDPLLLRRTMWGSSEGTMYACTPCPPFAADIASRSAVSLGSVAAEPLAPAIAVSVLLWRLVAFRWFTNGCRLRPEGSLTVCSMHAPTP